MGHNSKCFVPDCKTGYNSCKEKTSLFSAPKDENLRKLWDKAICRADRKLSEKDVVCAKHFLDTEIIKEWSSGRVVIPYKKPRLIPMAIPSVFSYKSPLVLPNKVQPKSKKREKHKNDKSAKSISPTSSTVSSTNISEPINNDYTITNNLFEELWQNRDILKMPNAEWTLHYINKNEQKSILISECTVANDGTPSFLRNIILDHNTQLKSFFGSVEINKDTLIKLSLQLTHPTNISDLQYYVNNFSSTNICAGGPSTKIYSLNKVAIETAKIDLNGLWRHNSCPLLFKDSERRCTWCKHVYDYFINHLLSSK